MKTLKNLFGKKETRKSIQNFATPLKMNAMIMIKGGDDDDDDNWPPKTGSGSSSGN